jgi:hypothetical protein
MKSIAVAAMRAMRHHLVHSIVVSKAMMLERLDFVVGLNQILIHDENRSIGWTHLLKSLVRFVGLRTNVETQGIMPCKPR